MTSRPSVPAPRAVPGRVRLAVLALALPALVLPALAAGARTAAAQQPTAVAAAPALPAPRVERVQLGPGRSYPLAFPSAVTRVAVANPEIADVIVVSDRDVVITGKVAGETDVLLWSAQGRRHLRVSVAPGSDRAQVVLAVKIAEVRRDALRALGTSVLYRALSPDRRGGSGIFNTDGALAADGRLTVPGQASFLTLLTDFGTRDLLAFLQAEEQRGTARALAEPNLMAANREEANFLAGGEIPIPIAQPGPNGQSFVTIVFREFGVRLSFTPEILSDSIIKLHVKPEVSSLDFSNAVTLSGVRIPALRTRRLSSTVDVRRDQSLVISGLLNDERTRVRTGIPGLMNIPVLGALFSSSSWQRNESELLIVVTPMVVDPNVPRAQDALRLTPDAQLPAREAIAPRLSPAAPAGGAPPAPRSPESRP